MRSGWSWRRVWRKMDESGISGRFDANSACCSKATGVGKYPLRAPGWQNVAPEGLFGNSVVWKQAGDVEVSYGVRNSSCADACDRVRIGRAEEQAKRLSGSSIAQDVEGEGTVHAMLVVPS
jgi:hypothetical protein